MPTQQVYKTWQDKGNFPFLPLRVLYRHNLKTPQGMLLGNTYSILLPDTVRDKPVLSTRLSQDCEIFIRNIKQCFADVMSEAISIILTEHEMSQIPEDHRF